jgi:hypothetical protein
MICSRSELLEIIKRTIEQATPEEKRQLREALCGNRCELGGRRRLTLLLDTTSGLLQCHQCVGSANAKAVFVREPGDLSEADRASLGELKVSWEEKSCLPRAQKAEVDDYIRHLQRYCTGLQTVLPSLT